MTSKDTEKRIMKYTTAWASEGIRTPEGWAKWLCSLTEGDRVLYQEFVPKEGYWAVAECWRFRPAIIKGGRVSHLHDAHPLKDGIARFPNSDTPYGKVFPSRIVPWHDDLTAPPVRFVEGHAPVYEPNWGPELCRYRRAATAQRSDPAPS